MRIVICAKEVLDPDAVNAYAVAGRLTIGEDGKTPASSGIPTLMNAYDEQAIEAALRLRDAGVDCTITVVAAGKESAHLKRAAALGVDELAHVPLDPSETDCLGAAAALSAYIRHSGGADLVLCGRQASDDDQGVVPPVIGERLGMPVVTMARDIVMAGDGRIRVTRVTPDGDEVVTCALPAVVTISNELGVPRYPTAAGMMAARKKTTTVVPLAELGLDGAALAPKVALTRLFVPTVQGNCEIIAGDAPEAAKLLLQRLRTEGVLS